MISYYDLLELVMNGEEPKEIDVKLVCGDPVRYKAEYDFDDFLCYHIEDSNRIDDNYRMYLSECFMESGMFDSSIEIVEDEDTALELLDDEVTLDQLRDKINVIIKHLIDKENK